MRAKAYILILLGLILAAGILVQAPAPLRDREVLNLQQEPRSVPAAIPEATKPRVVATYGKLPLSFELNQGQTDPQVKFLSRGRGHTLFLTGNEAVLTLRSSEAGSKGKWQEAKGKSEVGARFGPLAPNLQSLVPGPELARDTVRPTTDSLAVVRMKLVGGNPNAKVTGHDELPGKSNYFIGNDPKKWRTNVSNYAKVKYEGVYPGIDLVYYGTQSGRLEYDFVVAPGVDPKSIRLGIQSEIQNPKSQIDSNGDLVISTEAGDVRFRKPTVYQIENIKSKIHDRKFTEGRYILTANNQVSFEVGTYDKRLPLIIDPVLSYSTYFGGSDHDTLNDFAVDTSGNAYVLAQVPSLDFPSPSPVHVGPSGATDVFIAKLNAEGTAVDFTTFLGGSYGDYGFAVALDAAGNIYVTGSSWSDDFPTSPGASQPNLAGEPDAFATKLNPSGSALLYSTYLGGSGPFGGSDFGSAIAVNSAGEAWVAGTTRSTDFPTTAGAFDTTCGTDGDCDGWSTYSAEADVFLAKLDAAGSTLVYSTYLGASDFEQPDRLATDASGKAYLTGFTRSPDFPTSANAFDTTCGTVEGVCNGLYDGFVTKIDPSLTGTESLAYSTFLGGSSGDHLGGIAVDSAGIIYLTGSTFSPEYPVTAGAFDDSCGTDGACNGMADAVLTKIDPTKAGAASLLYSTYLGGSDTDAGFGVAVDPAGTIYVAGSTGSADFPTLQPIQAAQAGGTCGIAPDTYPCPDAFVLKLNAAGSALIFSTYLGGTKNEGAGGVGLDSSRDAYIAGYVYSSDFPTTAGSLKPTYNESCIDFPAGVVPFTQYYQIASGSQGNTLFVGKMTQDTYQMLKAAIPAASVPNQKFCEGVQLSTDFGSAPLYVPTAAEWAGDFSYFQGQILDPLTGVPFPSNIIPPERLPDPFAWRMAGYPGAGEGFVAKMSGLALPVGIHAPSMLAFDQQPVGSTSAAKIVTLSNIGDGPLSIISTTIDADFGETNPCGAAVAGYENCGFSVTFAPTTTGQLTGTLTIHTDAPGSPHEVQLSGTGTDFALGIASGGSSSAEVNAGQTATYRLTLSPDGFSGDVAMACGGAPQRASCTCSPSSLTLDGSTPADVTVSVTTTARSIVPPLTRLPPPGAGHRMPWLWWLLALAMLTSATLAARKRAAWGLSVALLSVMLWFACGGGGGGGPTPPPVQTGTPAGTYTLTVIATAGDLSRDTALTLRVN